jgi:hypothetical protein
MNHLSEHAMQTYTQRLVTVYEGGATQTTGGEIGPVSEVFAQIQGEAFAAAVGWIRRCLADGDDAAATEAKRQLPVVCWSGHFSARKIAGLLTHSGLLILDIDHREDAAELRDMLREDPHTVGAFVSPSGAGLKILVAVDGADGACHVDAWSAARAYYQGAYGIEADASGRDVSRACFVSHDAGAWCHDGAQPLPFERQERPAAALPLARNEDQALIPPGGRHAWIVAQAARLASIGLREPEIVAAIQAARGTRLSNEGRPITDQEILDAATSAVAKYLGPDQAAQIAQGAAAAESLLSPAGSTELRTHADRKRDRWEPTPMVVDGLLPAGGIGALIALPGIGKSLVGIELARCVAAGEPFAGHATTQGSVIYACPDSPASSERRMLAIPDEVAGRIGTLIDPPLLPGGIDALAQALDAAEGTLGHAPALLVLDTWDSIREHSDGGYAGQDGAAETIMRGLRKLAESRRMAIVVVHHATRGDGERARGTVVFDARCDWIAVVRQPEEAVCTVQTTKAREGERKQVGSWAILGVDVAGRSVPTLELQEAAEATQGDSLGDAERKDRETLRAILAIQQRGEIPCAATIAEALGTKRGGAVMRPIKRLRERGMVSMTGFALTTAGMQIVAGFATTTSLAVPPRSTPLERSGTGGTEGGTTEEDKTWQDEYWK